MSYKAINKWIDQKTSNQLLSGYFINLILVGPSQSGKSSILGRFTGNEFKQDMLSTIGVDFAIKIISINGINYKLRIVK